MGLLMFWRGVGGFNSIDRVCVCVGCFECRRQCSHTTTSRPAHELANAKVLDNLGVLALHQWRAPGDSTAVSQSVDLVAFDSFVIARALFTLECACGAQALLLVRKLLADFILVLPGPARVALA